MGQALYALGIDRMTVEERIALAQAELDRRLAEDDARPGDTVAWETVKAEARSRWQR